MGVRNQVPSEFATWALVVRRNVRARTTGARRAASAQYLPLRRGKKPPWSVSTSVFDRAVGFALAGACCCCPKALFPPPRIHFQHRRRRRRRRFANSTKGEVGGYRLEVGGTSKPPPPHEAVCENISARTHTQCAPTMSPIHPLTIHRSPAQRWDYVCRRRAPCLETSTSNAHACVALSPSFLSVCKQRPQPFAQKCRQCSYFAIPISFRSALKHEGQRADRRTICSITPRSIAISSVSGISFSA